MTKPYTPRMTLRRAELRVLRAAAGCVTAQGYAFTYVQGGIPQAHFPDSLHRLESALANLRSVRKHQQKNRRKRRGK